MSVNGITGGLTGGLPPVLLSVAGVVADGVILPPDCSADTFYLASPSDSEGGAGAMSGVPAGAGGGDTGDGVKKARRQAGATQSIDVTWDSLSGGGWGAVVPKGDAAVTLDLKGTQKCSYKEVTGKIFGGLSGVVASVAKHLARAGEMPAGQGIVYKMDVSRTAGKIILKELHITTDGQSEMSIHSKGIRAAEVASAGQRTRIFNLSLDGAPREVIPENRIPERPPEGEDDGPSLQDVDSAVLALWTLDVQLPNWAVSMKEALGILKKASGAEFDIYFQDMLKACEAFFDAIEASEYKRTVGASQEVQRTRTELLKRFGEWKLSHQGRQRVEQALRRAGISVPERPQEADGVVISIHVAGLERVVEWLDTHGYTKPTEMSELNQRCLRNARPPWEPDDVIDLLDALENNGEGGREFIGRLINDYVVMKHSFSINDGDIRKWWLLYVLPADIVLFLRRCRSFTRREINQLVEIVALTRLGILLNVVGMSNETPADEESIRKTITAVAESIGERKQVPLPVYFNLNENSDPPLERFQCWIGKLRMYMTNDNGRDLFMSVPHIEGTEFEWSRSVLGLISETGYTGKLWLVKSTGDLIGEFDSSMLEETPVPAEDELSLLSVDRFPGGLIEWVEGYLGAEVSQQSIFYKVGGEISPNGMISLIKKLVTDGGTGGREFLARLASGAETMTRFVETEAHGFGVDVPIAPEVLREFLDNSGNGSADDYVRIVDILASFRVGWASIMSGRKARGTVNERSLIATEHAVAAHTGKYGIVPTVVTFRIDGDDWDVNKIIKLLRAELVAHPDKPFVFILGSSPLERKVPGPFLNHALNLMIEETGYKSWFVLANIDGDTIYDSEAR